MGDRVYCLIQQSQAWQVACIFEVGVPCGSGRPCVAGKVSGGCQGGHEPAVRKVM